MKNINFNLTKIIPNYNCILIFYRKSYVLTINWLVAGVALATILTALADWTCPTTTMFMDTFSAPIFDLLVGFCG